MWVVLLAAKSEAVGAIKHVQAATEKECGRKLRVLRTDNGGEFMAAEFTAYCADEGVTRHFLTPYTPQQNGVVERQNQMVVAMVRVLLKQRGVPVDFWGRPWSPRSTCRTGSRRRVSPVTHPMRLGMDGSRR
jgi:transposase InsO family protein